jgi:hypothetical protein
LEDTNHAGESESCVVGHSPKTASNCRMEPKSVDNNSVSNFLHIEPSSVPIYEFAMWIVWPCRDYFYFVTERTQLFRDELQASWRRSDFGREVLRYKEKAQGI